MKRKIVQHGSSSLTITLPVKWVDKFKLQKGGELKVEEAGPTLIISTEQEIASPKKEISVSDFGIFTANNLSHLYQLGYDEIEIRYDDHKTLEEIKKRLPQCLGFEIIDQKEHKIYLKSIATTLDSEFDQLLRKAFLLTNEMAQGLLLAFEKRKYETLPGLRDLESLNNKFTDVCIRILNKKGHKVPQRTMQMYEVVKNLERIADEFKYLCDLLFSSQLKPEAELLVSLREAVDYYLAFYQMFYKFSPELKKRIYLERKELTQKFLRQMGTAKGARAVFFHHLVNLVQKTYDGAGGYFALVL